MQYSVYTDAAASTEKNCVGCAYLIITDNDYVNSKTVTVAGFDNPTEAETVALGIAANYLMESVDLQKTDSVQFLTDCTAAVKFARQYMKNDDKVRSKNEYVRSSITMLRELDKMVKLSFNKVAGHKASCNPNKHVDALAKLAIRR